MLKMIIEKELLARFSDSTFVIACILGSVLIFLGFYFSVRNYSDLVVDYNGMQELNRNLLQAQQTYNEIDTKGIGISKPPEVLSIFSVGIANYIGRNLNINSFSTPQLQGSNVENNPIFVLFGTLDLMFIFKNVLSLLAIVFSYNLLSGEKEGGTLRLIASFPVPRDTLILGKLIGGLISLFIPLLIPLLLGTAVVLLLPNIHFDSDDYVRLMFIVVIFFLYLTVFFFLSAFVSARTKSSSVSFLIALFIWVLAVLIIPRSSIIVAAQFIQVPSSQQYLIEKTRLTNDIFQKYNQIEQKLRGDQSTRLSMEEMDIKTLREHSKRRWDEYQKKRREIGEQRDMELEDAQARIGREYQQRQQNLANLAITLSRISPASAMTYATTSFTDTGMGGFEHFIRSLKGYRERYIAFMKTKIKNRKIIRVASDGAIEEEIIEGIIVESRDGGELLNTFSEKSEKPDLHEIPVYTYQKMSLASVVQETIVDILLLILLSLLLFIGTYVSFLKYDVR